MKLSWFWLRHSLLKLFILLCKKKIIMNKQVAQDHFPIAHFPILSLLISPTLFPAYNKSLSIPGISLFLILCSFPLKGSNASSILVFSSILLGYYFQSSTLYPHKYRPFRYNCYHNPMYKLFFNRSLVRRCISVFWHG